MSVELGVPPEEIRVMAVAIGQREAARHLGLNENTVKSICYRAGDGKKLATALQIKGEQSLHPNAPRPSDALQKVLQERQGQSKLNLSEYLVEASASAAKVKGPASLDIAPLVKTLGDLHSRIYPEVASDQSTHISFFSISGQFAPDTEEKPVYDAPSDDPEDY